MPLRRAGRLTIPARIFAGIGLLVVGFLAALGPSILAHRGTARQLRLLHEGYLPLALTLSTAKADHAVYTSMVERMLAEPQPRRTGEWVRRALEQVMPATIERALGEVETARALRPGGEDQVILDELHELLVEVRAGYADTAPLEVYFDSLDAPRRSEAEGPLAALRRRDRTLTYNLRRSVDVLQRRVAELSAAAEVDQARAMWVSLASTMLGLLAGAFVLVWARQLLAPLPRLEARMLQVASGDLSPAQGVIDPARTDELAGLAIELEKMVQALSARDAQLRDAADRLVRSERLAAMGKMAAHVTHEVRNPLTSIHLNVELLEDEIASDAKESLAILASIRREVDRLSSITEEYLKLARLPSPRLEREDLALLVREVTAFVAREFEAARIELRVEASDASPVLGDEAQLRQVLMNLLRNAREAMPEGGPVDVSVRREEESIEVVVADRGPGIPEEARGRILDAFYSTKEGGTGLGLPLVQQIVSSHKGTMVVGDREGGGTTFVLRFPLAE